jgi:competence protein ComEC
MTPALICMAAWCAGVTLTESLLPAQWLVGAVALTSSALAVPLALVVRPAVMGLALLAGLLGAARAELPHGDPGAAERASRLAGAEAVLIAVVAEDPRPFAGGYEFTLEPQTLTTAASTQPGTGSVVVRAKAAAVVPGPGDRVRAVGKLELPRNRPGFDRRAYLAQRGAYLEMPSGQITLMQSEGGIRGLPGWLRDNYRKGIKELMPQPHAAVLVGVVLGVRAEIPQRLEQELIATGLVHLLVLSGLKVAVFARLARGALAPFLGRAATFPILAVIALYALAGGATPAAIRAAAMGGLALAAAHLGRPTYVWTSLTATAAGMLAWRPELTWDVGFQLSFVGTAAIVLLTPSIEHRLPWLPAWLREPFAVTCAAQLGTVPFMATNFNVLSPVGPVANALVLPLLPALIAAGLLIAPLALVPGLGQLAAMPVVGLLAYLEQVAGVLARIPAAALPVPDLPAWAGLTYYLALGAAIVAGRTRGGTRRLAVLVGLVVPLAIGGVELMSWGRTAPAVHLLSVGNGQAVLLSGTDGYLLADGGPSPSRLAAGLGARLPPWRHQLDGLIITGSGLGHAGGLTGFDYSARQVLVPEGGFAGSTARSAALAAAAGGASVLTVHAGQRWKLAGLDVQVLAPTPAPLEPSQLAFRVQAPSGRSFCDFADLEPDEQAAAAGVLAGPCTYLLLPSGGRSTPAPELLARGRPQRLLVSDAGGTLARDLPRGSLLRTSQEGDISLPL